MKIALINENSQAAKNAMIFEVLKKVTEPMGHEAVNYGMYSAEDLNSLTYVQNGILAAVLLNSGAADYVITGCFRRCCAVILNLPWTLICSPRSMTATVWRFLLRRISAGAES